MYASLYPPTTFFFALSSFFTAPIFVCFAVPFPVVFVVEERTPYLLACLLFLFLIGYAFNGVFYNISCNIGVYVLVRGVGASMIRLQGSWHHTEAL